MWVVFGILIPVLRYPLAVILVFAFLYSEELCLKRKERQILRNRRLLFISVFRKKYLPGDIGSVYLKRSNVGENSDPMYIVEYHVLSSSNFAIYAGRTKKKAMILKELLERYHPEIKITIPDEYELLNN